MFGARRSSPYWRIVSRSRYRVWNPRSSATTSERATRRSVNSNTSSASTGRTRAHRFGRFEGPAAAEHRHPGQQSLLGFAQQVVGPVDRGPQRLVALDLPRHPPPAAGTGGRGAPRDHADSSPVAAPQRTRSPAGTPSRRRHTCPIDSAFSAVTSSSDLNPRARSTNSRTASHVHDRREGRLRARRAQRRNGQDSLAINAEAFTARRQHLHPRDKTARASPPTRQPRRGRAHNCRNTSSNSLCAQELDQRLLERQTRARRHVEHLAPTASSTPSGSRTGASSTSHAPCLNSATPPLRPAPPDASCPPRLHPSGSPPEPQPARRPRRPIISVRGPRTSVT